MKKLTVVIASLTFALLSVNSYAHGFQNNHFGSTIGFSNSSHYSSYSMPYYPSNSLIMGITYRNYQSRIGLQNRIYNGRISNSQIYNNRTYNNGYRQGYSDGRRSVNNNDYRSNRYNRTCFESYYDRYGNRVERSLPASACRH
jgi:hypothetical protein